LSGKRQGFDKCGDLLAAVDKAAEKQFRALEGIAAVLTTVNRRYKLKNSGFKITGL